MVWPIIAAAAKEIIGVGADYVQGRRERGKLKHERELARLQGEIEMAKRLAQTEADYDVQALRQQSYSWKDEYLVLLWSLPYLIAFAPVALLTIQMPFDSEVSDADVHAALTNAWAALAGSPAWWHWSWIGIVAATFGLRWMWGKRLKQ